MKKLSAAILSIFCCTHNIHSMEREEQTTDFSEQPDKQNYMTIKIAELSQSQRLSLFHDQLYAKESYKPRFIEVKAERYDPITGEYFFYDNT